MLTKLNKQEVESNAVFNNRFIFRNVFLDISINWQ